MWCSTCQQDAPALGSTSEGTLRCGKCGGSLTATDQTGGRVSRVAESQAAQQAFSPPQTATLQKLLRATPLSNEDWAIEAELRGIQRLIGSLKSRPNDPAEAPQRSAPHLPPSHWKNAEVNKPELSTPPVEKQSSQPHAAAWTILFIGFVLFVCGAVILGYSLVAHRTDLWPIGVPLALIGQAGLILGLTWHLYGLWNSNRRTVDALSDLDGELQSVREATTRLSASHAGGAQSFYLHLAEGASPHILLADLKGQMDLLAKQMARHGRP